MIRGAVILAVLVGGAALSAQVLDPSPSPRFDVASIKLNTTTKIPLSEGHLAFLRVAGAGNARNGRFWMTGDIGATPLTVLIQLAYNVKLLQIDGGPSWVRSDRYEVDARAEGSATFEQMRPMLQSLLAERFKLTLRRGTREMSFYELVASADGFKIAAMKEGGCADPELAKPFEPLKSCGGFRRQSTPEGQVLEAVGIPMTTMADLLSDSVGRVVVDKTGFTELFSFRLQFANRTTDPSGPSMFGALEEQLGMRMRSVTGPVEVLVIDSVERPTPD